MCATPRSAIWPRLVAISLIGLGAASCSADSGRFNEGFGSNSSASSRGDVAGSIPQSGPASRVESRRLPHLASNESDGTSGVGRGMGSYQPSGSAEITGSIAAPPPRPAWTWEGGTPVTVAPGETLELIARRHGVPVSAIMETNNITSPAMVHPGQHLVIPRYRASTAAATPPAPHTVATRPVVPSVAPVGAPRTALTAPPTVHVVGRGETLDSIARLYNKPVMVLANANNLRPDTIVKVGDRIVIADAHGGPQAQPVASRAETPAQLPTGAIASAESPHSARLATPAAPTPEQNSVKTAEPAGSLPTFRWPVRGRVIAAFGPKPNGVQNDGINLAVPEGTPIKAAEDGVVAYAGNELKGYGNLVLVRHANGFVTAYAHASDILVKRGDTVKRGQVIAHSGQTGNVTSPQLHFEIRKGATPVDPAQYLKGA